MGRGTGWQNLGVHGERGGTWGYLDVTCPPSPPVDYSLFSEMLLQHPRGVTWGTPQSSGGYLRGSWRCMRLPGSYLGLPGCHLSLISHLSDYYLFSEMLLQRPLGGRDSRLLGPHGAHLAQVGTPGAHLGVPEGHLSGEERGYMQSMAVHRFPHILQVLRALPRPMLLVFRNINTVRSVHHALGAPADRYGIMARR